MSKSDLRLAPSPADKQRVREIFYGTPIVERGKPLLSEMVWVLGERPDLESHEKILPDYCYNIFEVFQKTCFKGFPLLNDSVLVIDPAGVKSAETVEQAKKMLRIDWKNLGRIVGIGMRCMRFAELESADEQDGEGFGDLTPDQAKVVFTVIYGRAWVEYNLPRMNLETVDETLAAMLNQHLAPWLENLQTMQPKLGELARQWSPEAMQQFYEGLAEGMASFIDAAGRLAGESRRFGIYGFLLFMWPEMKAMLASTPKSTLTDLHEWMKPFMGLGVTTYLDIETLRDVCAPAPSGIGLSLRPLNPRGHRASA